MVSLLGLNQDGVPLLVGPQDSGTDLEDFQLLLYQPANGLMVHVDEDSVRAYATLQYLLKHGCPVFESLSAAETWLQTNE